jgi:hypothetical protein
VRCGAGLVAGFVAAPFAVVVPEAVVEREPVAVVEPEPEVVAEVEAAAVVEEEDSPVAEAEAVLMEAAPVEAPVAEAAEDDVEVKANSKSMIFHTPSSPYYKRMKGDVTFRSVAEAEAAGYTQWSPKSKVSSAQ